MTASFQPQQLLAMVPMFGLLTAAVVTDLRWRRIPNWLTFSLVACGLFQSLLSWHVVTPVQSLLGLLVGFALNLPLFAMRVRGGGDLKLFAGLGAWVGPLATFEVFIISTVVAALCAVAQCAASGRLHALFRNTALLAVSAAHPRELGLAHATRPDGSFRSVGRSVPYAVPVIVSVLLVIAFL
jgi:prepilin peptidase CpaA